MAHPPINPSAQASPSVCQWGTCTEPVWDAEQGRCILHSVDEAKDPAEFKKRIRQKLASGDVGFAGAFFPEDITFGQMSFDGADFYNAVFRGMARFHFAQFRKQSCFIGTRFVGPAVFFGAHFANGADFTNATFHALANFTGARFVETTDFSGAKFEGRANYDQAKIVGPARFVRAKFGGGANFHRCEFADTADFTLGWFSGKSDYRYLSPLKSDFKGAASFFETSFGGRTYFTGGHFEGPIDFEKAQFRDAAIFANIVGDPHFRFQSVVLERPRAVRFENFDLANTTLANTDLREIRFHSITWPRKGSRVILCDEAHNPQASPEAIRVLYRDIKANLEDARDWLLAGEFYYAEMETARRHEKRRGWRWLLHFYWFLAGYGERPLRASLVFCGLICLLSLLLWTPYATFYFDKRQVIQYEWHLSWTNALAHSVRAVFLRPLFFQPESKWAHALTLIGNVIGPVQLTLLAVTLRRWLRR